MPCLSMKIYTAESAKKLKYTAVKYLDAEIEELTTEIEEIEEGIDLLERLNELGDSLSEIEFEEEEGKSNNLWQILQNY